MRNDWADALQINNPTVLARVSHKELEALFIGYGWTPYFVEGSDIPSMHQAMAATMERCVTKIREYQKQARDSGKAFRPRWPMIVLRTPKGWTGPSKVDGDHFLEGFWRSHQVPLTNVLKDKSQLKLLEEWMRGYEPEKHFDKDGKLVPELRELAPTGNRRMSANPVTNGGSIRNKLHMPDFREYSIEVTKGGVAKVGSMSNCANFLRDVMKLNPKDFRLFGPDETQSNKLGNVYEAGKKVWMGEYLDMDEDGGNLAYEGRVMEMLSEHTVEVGKSVRIADNLLMLLRAGSRVTSFLEDTDCLTATSLSFTSLTPWSTSTASGSRSVSRLNGGKRSRHSTFSSRQPSGVKTTTDSLIKIPVS
jgi:xylulose-5-phosphate/fructose-6-phosphate phosphoketolase